MSCVSTRQMSWLSTRHMSCVSTLRHAPVFTANTKETTKGAAEGRPPLWRRPKAASFVLAVDTGHILVLRRKTCALLRARTSALLRRKTCAVLRARTCALFRTNTTRRPQDRKSTAFGGVLDKKEHLLEALLTESQPLLAESQPLLTESQPLLTESQPLLTESQFSDKKVSLLDALWGNFGDFCRCWGFLEH